ncbi:hypothetical protein [uncultured Gimesia sp.]|uniref:hypothetical protein n=1 Tax=uncultured Gimesia sp. TaxID=1678688 RepID=UPI002621CD48|nr:hypothetical protein [uncultured Gimesia sp.]
MIKTVIYSLLILIVFIVPGITSADDKKPATAKKQVDIKKEAKIKKLLSKHIASIRKSDENATMKDSPEALDQLLDLRMKSRIRGYENNKQFRETDKNVRKAFATKVQINPEKIDKHFEKVTLDSFEGNFKSYEAFYKNYIKKDEQLKKLSHDDVIHIYVNYSATIYSQDRAAWDSIWGASIIYPLCKPKHPSMSELETHIKKINTNLKTTVGSK